MIIPDPEGGLVLAHGVDSSDVCQRARVSAASRWQVEDMYVALFGGGSDLAAAAGTNIKRLGVVPAGHVYVYTTGCAMCSTGVRRTEIGVLSGGVYYPAVSSAAPAAWSGVTLNGAVYVAPDANLYFRWFGCAAGDDIWWCAVGHDVTTL
jgi:hypothetical protein